MPVPAYDHDYSRRWTVAEHYLHLHEATGLPLEVCAKIVAHYIAQDIIIPITPEELASHQARAFILAPDCEID